METGDSSEKSGITMDESAEPSGEAVIEITESEEPDSEWDKRLLENNSSFYQTAGYAEYMKEALGMKLLFLTARSKGDGKIVGQLAVHYGPLFCKYLKGRHPFLFKVFFRMFKTYHFIKGPAIFDQSMKKEIYESLVRHMDNLGKKAYMLQDLSLPVGEDESVHKIFYDRGFYSDSWGTILVDLEKSEEELLNDVGRDQRKKIKKAQEMNLAVKEAQTPEDYEKAIAVVENMSARNGIFEGTSDYYRTLFRVLSERKMIKTFIIEHNGNLVSTISLYLFGKSSLRALPAHTDYSLQEKIPGMAYIEWHAIKWAKANGYSSYDLTGIRPDSKDSKDNSLMEHKMRWGGRVVSYPYFSKVYSKSKTKLANMMRKMYKK